MLELKRAGRTDPNLTVWTEKRPGFANRTQALPVLGISTPGAAAGRWRRWTNLYEHTRGMSLPRFAKYRPQCSHRETRDSI
jgi:hypothetical protein